MATDPVCKMKVKKKKAKFKSDYKGSTFYFCAKGCKDSFDEDPEKYLGGV
jgi:YHS domain-containing protein